MMYTHIMNLAIWSTEENKIIDNCDLLNELKNAIIGKELI